MRRISILEENYMALEGNIAESIDKADAEILEINEGIDEVIRSLKSGIQGQGPLSQDPMFINFANDPNVSPVVMLQKISESLQVAVNSIKDKKVLSLSDVALMSKAFAKLIGAPEEGYDDEVEEAVFFFGRKNTNIPDSATNVFIVQISDAAKQRAIENFIQLQSVISRVKIEITEGVESGSLDRIGAAMKEISLIGLLVEPLV